MYGSNMKKLSKGLRGKAYVEWLAAKAQLYDEIKTLYQAERSLYVVAKRYGLSRARVSQIVNGK
jgi:DNA-directed RNA polymerase specialized sigma subunit